MTNVPFGLAEHPFQLTPDPRFWFESATHKKAMAYLGYGLQQGEGFVVITGEIGAGKTTLVGHLLNRLDPARIDAIQLVTTQVEGDDLLRLVAQGFKVNVAGLEKAQLLGVIEHVLNDRAKKGQRTLLIVDEAQALSPSAVEELRMLSNFQGQGRALVQILLLGQPEFRATLNEPKHEQLRQRVIASHHLTGMTADEVGAYLNHRLMLVGWQGQPTFSPDAVAALHRTTGGIPRKINAIASRALMMAALERKAAIDVQMISQIINEIDVEHPQIMAADSVSAAIQQPAALDAAARLSSLEAQVSEQESALRRMLSLMVEWVESEIPAPTPMKMAHAPAA